MPEHTQQHIMCRIFVGGGVLGFLAQLLCKSERFHDTDWGKVLQWLPPPPTQQVSGMFSPSLSCSCC